MVRQFRKRHMISFKCINAKSVSANTESINERFSKLSSLIEDYAPEDILNVNEFRQFYHTLPNKTICLKNEKCPGQKKFKEQLTVLLCSGMIRVKKSPLIIRKTPKFKCFKGMKLLKFRIQWKENHES